MNRLLALALLFLIVAAGIFSYFFFCRAVDCSSRGNEDMNAIPRAWQREENVMAPGEANAPQLALNLLPLIEGQGSAEHQFLLFSDLSSRKTPRFRRDVARVAQSMGYEVAIREVPYIPGVDLREDLMALVAAWRADEALCRRILFDTLARSGPDSGIVFREELERAMPLKVTERNLGQTPEGAVGLAEELMFWAPEYGSVLISARGESHTIGETARIARFVAKEIGGSLPASIRERPEPHPSLSHPCIWIEDGGLQLGNLRAREEKVISVDIGNVGHDLLLIEDVECEVGVDILTGELKIVKTGESILMEFAVTVPELEGIFTRMVRIHSNDPSGVRELSITGRVMREKVDGFTAMALVPVSPRGEF
ncbi:MAG: hypothetical protein AAGJ79_14600 [Verrucomicrobiota bacterium]